MKESKKTQIMNLLLDAAAGHLSSAVRFTDIREAINIVRNKAFWTPIGMYSLALYGKSAYLTKPSKKEPRYLKRLSHGLYVVTTDPASVVDPVKAAKPTKPAPIFTEDEMATYFIQETDKLTTTINVRYHYHTGKHLLFTPAINFDPNEYDKVLFKDMAVMADKKTGRAYVIASTPRLVSALGMKTFLTMYNKGKDLIINKVYDTEGYTDPAYAELLKEGYEAQDRGEQAKFICEDCGAEISVKWILPNPDNRLYPPTIPFVPFEIVVSCNCNKKIALSPLNYVTNLEWIKQYGLEYAFTIKSGDTSYSLLGLAAYRRNGTQWSQK